MPQPVHGASVLAISMVSRSARGQTTTQRRGGTGRAEVRVREKHTDACGGEPDVSPVLFFLKLRKRDGHAVTTAYDGEHYRALKPQPAK